MRERGAPACRSRRARLRCTSPGSTIEIVEWVLLFVLWAPVLGALLLRAAIDDPERRARALGGYVRAALFLHALALPPMLVSYGVALLVLAGFDAALLAMVYAARADERELARVLALLGRPESSELGVRAARDWLSTLVRRAGADGLRVDHAVACARALDAIGRTREAEEILDAVPRTLLAPRDAARVDLAIALLAIERGDLARARELSARALGRAPAGAAESVTARAAWALLDAVDGHARRALIGIARIPGPLSAPLDRALVALARAHVLASRGEPAAARALLRELDRDALIRAERLATSCPGPASALVHALDGSLAAPYR